MRWASTLQRDEDTETAVREAAAALEAALDGERVDLLFAFVSAHHSGLYAAVPALLRQRFPGAAVLGCSSSGVVGDGEEVEEGPALSVIAAHLPDVEVRVFHAELADGVPDAEGWRALVGIDPLVAPSFVLIPDPFSLSGEALVHNLDEAYPHSTTIGGVASGGDAPGEVALLADGFLHRRGVVGVALSGDIQMDTVVAQGARAVGAVFEVTAARGNLIQELDGEPATEVISRVFEGLSGIEQHLFQRQPMIGINPPGAASAGDALVRRIMGVHRPSGMVAVAFTPEPGQRVQFQLRDVTAAHHELANLLHHQVELHPDDRALGVLQFSCLGRGHGFFGQPDHDVTLVKQILGRAAVAGFFANGEIGPVRGRTHLHSHTSSIGVFRRAGWN
jgi:small ligand-binding sensory domain FIST